MDGRFYCLVYADLLDFSVSKQAVEMLSVVTQGLAGMTGEREYDGILKKLFAKHEQVFRHGIIVWKYNTFQ